MYAHFDGIGLRLAALDRARRRMDSVSGGFGWGRPSTTAGSSGWTDEGDHYRIRVAAPGLVPSDLQLEVEGDVLTVKGRRTVAVPAGFHVERRERRTFDLSRRYAFPDAVDGQGITAALVNGVLTLIVPRAASAGARKIPVEVN